MYEFVFFVVIHTQTYSKDSTFSRYICNGYFLYSEPYTCMWYI